MSLDKLAVIFIIIILPISVVLSAYTNAQTETLKLQISYDEKLNNATSDALKAYQLNAFNETTSDLASMKIQEINAAANAFFNSIATNFNMTGYSKDDIEDYVPALVFTMYDGYYLYSRYTNTLTEEDYTEGNGKPSTYTNGQRLEGLKPFVSYSCRYKRGSDDFVISYTLDNFISIQGNININGKLTWVNDSGYIIDPTKVEVDPDKAVVKYRGIEIGAEDINTLKERIGTEDYVYHRSNGVKYYYDPSHVDSRGNPDPKWFTLLNGTKNYSNRKFDITNDYSAYNYYKEAKEFTNRIINDYKLGNLSTANAVNEKGEALNLGVTMNIFDTNGIEEKTSNFNEHRLAVIKYTIEKNLSVAIANYNNYSLNVKTNFQMPVLKETEWDKILNNMTLISFLQGLPIGGKIYNGCSVIANNKNNEVVAEESIYLTMGTNYYKSTYTDFESLINNLGKTPIGIFNVDLERRNIQDDNGQTDYYYPKGYYADYDSIISPTKNANIYADTDDIARNMYAYNGNIYKYMDKLAENTNTIAVAKAYYTALARERYGAYKVARTYNIEQNISSYNVPNDIDTKLFESSNHSYKLFYDKKTWEQAAAYCESLGGHLLTINSENELEEFRQEFGTQRVWIGFKNGNQYYTGEYYYNGNNQIPAEEVCNANSNLIKYNATAKNMFICEWD